MGLNTIFIQTSHCKGLTFVLPNYALRNVGGSSDKSCYTFVSLTGMYQRLDKMRKNAFGSVCLFGTDNDSSISGIWIWRGQGLAFEVSASENTTMKFTFGVTSFFGVADYTLFSPHPAIARLAD